MKCEWLKNESNYYVTYFDSARRQAFWQYYRSKQISNVYKKLLEKNPPQMPRKFLPRMIETETKKQKMKWKSEHYLVQKSSNLKYIYKTCVQKSMKYD